MSCFFFFNDTATTEIYTLSLHDALPILAGPSVRQRHAHLDHGLRGVGDGDHTEAKGEAHLHMPLIALDFLQLHFHAPGDRKSTRLNSSHANISYAVFCLKKKKSINNHTT